MNVDVDNIGIDVDMGVAEEPNVEPVVQIPPELSTRKTSIVWKQFDQVSEKDKDGVVIKKPNGKALMKAVCKICSSKLVFGGSSGTTHLKRHMIRCVKRTECVGGQTIVGRTETGGIYSFTFNQERARKETVRYIIREELPFNKVDKPAFKRYMLKAFGPQFKPISRKTLRADMFEMFSKGKDDLKELLKNIPGKVCFTSDMWTSNQVLGYVCLTAHFITEDWKLHKRIISFSMLPSPHTGKAIGDAIYANLLAWNLCDKIGTITLDNASNNDLCVSRLRSSLFRNDKVGRELFHQRCCAHILNLLVKDGLKFVESSLHNIRESVRHAKSSQSKLEKFFDACESSNMKKRRLPIDIQTRWNSTYLMLLAAAPYKGTFELFFYDSDFVNIPSDIDWHNAAVIRDFLKPFYESTKLFSGMKYVTSSVFCFQLTKIAMLLKRYEHEPSFRNLCESIKLKYDKYWKDIPKVLGLASCMDPRYKLTVLELCLDLNYNYVAPPVTEVNPIPKENPKLKDYRVTLYELFEEYSRKMNQDGSVVTEATTSSVGDDNMVFALLSKRRELAVKTCKSDLQRYLDQPTIVDSSESFDVLEWWKTQGTAYPILAAMARDLLTIPVSTVPSESVFSASERVVSKCRSSLLPETVEALICLKDWFQAEEGLQDEDLEDFEAHMLMEDQDL